ncbi:MAG: glutamine amidotransferase [Candidatus Omnitrophota bacterium]
MAQKVRVLGKGRKTLALLLRFAVLIALVLALAEVEFLEKGEGLAVFFAIDRSSSVPQDEQQFSLAYVQERLDAIPEGDQAGILFFGKDAAIQENPGENVKLQEYQTNINAEGSDLEAAVSLAMAAFPDGKQKRIVLLTDGNQTQGDIESAARRSKASGVDLRLLPLEYSYTQEVLVEDIVLPANIREKEPFTIKATALAQEAGTGSLRIMENGEVIAQREVDLSPGKNVYQISRSIEKAGVYNYEAVLEAINDRRSSNNRAQNFAIVKGMPRVLLLESESEDGRFLAASLLAEGIQTEMRTPDQLPSNLRELQAYDSVILSNVHSSELAHSQQKMLEAAVSDLGIGLVMIGGPESFDAGGYRGTPVERALPVTMDVKQKRVIPSGALVMIMHSCEIPQGNYWAQATAEEALNLLSRNDYVGFLYYGMGGEKWLFPLEKAGDKRSQRDAIRNLRNTSIGDMPSFDATLKMAYDDLIKVSANLKHIVIMSDGDPQRPDPVLLQNIKNAKISVSTVCIAPHNPSNSEMMSDLAQFTGGNFYLIRNNKDLPKIFIKEASVVRRNTLVEEPFTPAVSQPSEIIRGFDGGFPQLGGYDVVGPRPEAETVLVSHKNDPVLAQWRYGLGKSVAFTSDAKPRWGENWLNWEGYAKFWSQLVRWTLRSGEEENFQIQTTYDGDRVKVVVDALTPEGEFINNLSFSAASIDPSHQSKEFSMRQTEPGRYEGVFSADAQGSYILSMSYKGSNGEEGNVVSGMAIPYSPEHSTTRQNDAILKRISEIGGKPLLTAQDSVFTHDLEATGDIQPLWPFFLGAALILFFCDVAVRRVFFELPQLQRFMARVWDWLMFPFRRRTAPIGPATEEIGKLMQAKARASEVEPARAELKDDFLRRLEAVKEEELAKIDESAVKPNLSWQEAKKDEEPQKFADEEKDAYTSALFRAKQRAKDSLDERRK